MLNKTEIGQNNIQDERKNKSKQFLNKKKIISSNY